MIKNKNLIIICFTIILLVIISIYLYFHNNSYEEIENTEQILIDNEKNSYTEDKPRTIIVHISGEVNNPGIIGLDEGGRIVNAIEYAGGITENADLTNVNLAYELEDGQKIYIPSINDSEEISIIQDNGENIILDNMNNKKQSKININKATEEELQKLNGIGASTAKKIIQYRTENGNFKNIEDLKNVNGIGESKYEMIKEYICVK